MSSEHNGQSYLTFIRRDGKSAQMFMRMSVTFKGGTPSLSDPEASRTDPYEYIDWFEIRSVGAPILRTLSIQEAA